MLNIRAVPENVLRGVGGNDFSVRYPVVKNKKYVRDMEAFSKKTCPGYGGIFKKTCPGYGGIR